MIIPLRKKKKRVLESKRNHLAKMNAPAFTARYHAAYDQAIILFMNGLFSYTEEQRSRIYRHILKLLEIAIEARKSIPLPGSKDSDPIVQYLLLLKDTMQAAYALVTHEMILFQEEKQLSRFIGSEISTQLKSTDEIFVNSELNIYHSTNELIEMANPAMLRQRERMIKSFQGEDLLRYKKAFSEFSTIYAKFDVKAK